MPCRPLTAMAPFPPQQGGSRLRSDPDVVSWTRVSYATGDLDGQAVPPAVRQPARGVHASHPVRAPGRREGTRSPDRQLPLDGRRARPAGCRPGCRRFAALGLTVFASVRRRRDLAVPKTIGFTRRQLAATVAWQASVAAIVGIVVGVLIALGPSLWTLFAPADLRGARTYRSGRGARPGSTRPAPTRQPGGGTAGPQRVPHGDGSRAARGMSAAAARGTCTRRSWW
jgi:hypothetical protein